MLNNLAPITNKFDLLTFWIQRYDMFNHMINTWVIKTKVIRKSVYQGKGNSRVITPSSVYYFCPTWWVTGVTPKL